MIARVAIAIVLFAALAAIAFWIERRKRTDAPPTPVGRPPEQLDRADFARILGGDDAAKQVLPLMQTRDELYKHLDYHAYERKIDELYAKDKLKVGD